MGLHIADEELESAHLSAEVLRREIALLLFQQDRRMRGRASAFKGVRQLDFQRLLAARRISVHDDIAEYETDLRTLQALGDL
jgi:predicted HTH domain antitoxin